MPRKTRFRNVGAGKGVKLRLDAKTLRELYCDRGLSQAEIALREGCTPQFISKLMIEYGIETHRGRQKPSG